MISRQETKLMKTRKHILSIVLASLSASALAWPTLTDWRWQTGDGALDDATKWQNGIFPKSGTHFALFDQWEHNYTITLPNGKFDVPFGFRAPHKGGT